LLSQDLEREELPPHMTRVSEAEIKRVSVPQFGILLIKLTPKTDRSLEAQLLSSYQFFSSMDSTKKLLIINLIGLEAGFVVCLLTLWARFLDTAIP
jgi:hypothetical protein